MKPNLTAAVAVAIVMASICFFMVGAIVGNKTGMSQLCFTQFKGEIRDGKCVLVTVTEITK